MKVVEQVFRQYDPWLKQPEVFRKSFFPEQAEITLRPFFIPADFHVYNEWISEEINKVKEPGRSVSLFSENYFVAVLESSNAQCLWGSINGEPAFQVDFYKALHYHSADHFPSTRLSDGDAVMQLVVAPSLLSHLTLLDVILPACFEYLEQDTGIDRVLLVLDRITPYISMAGKARPRLQIPLGQARSMFIYQLIR